MGLLDDAIREHLDLKRQHGAEPGEVARLEQEALGPPVRETQEALAGTATVTAASPPPAAAVEAGDHELHEPVEHDEPVPGPDPTGRAPPATSMHEDTAAFDAEEMFADEPAAPAPAPDAPAQDDADQSQLSEDVLEETPEFLQETPEHDRLWFEQKPPRDFDFED